MAKYNNLDITEKVCVVSSQDFNDKLSASEIKDNLNVENTSTTQQNPSAPNTGFQINNEYLGQASIFLGVALAIISWRIYKK